MREFKFRVWDKIDKLWYWTEDDLRFGEELLGVDYFMRNPRRYIVQQFTGSLAKRNKEIWEGDIVKETITKLRGYTDNPAKQLEQEQTGSWTLDIPIIYFAEVVWCPVYRAFVLEGKERQRVTGRRFPLNTENLEIVGTAVENPNLKQ
jgi:hypothetical protein